MSAQMRWPHIGRFLRVDDSTGWVDDDHLTFTGVETWLAPVEQAAAYEEWADFYEWRLEERSDVLSTDRVRRHLMAEWTESMAFSCRRSAAFARGEHPGPWTPLSVRRPDLDAERQAIVAGTTANPAA